MTKLFCLSLCLCLLVSLSEALYFYVTDQPRCFIEEVPSETLVVGSYKNPDFVEWGTTGSEFTGVSIQVSVTDPQNSAMLTRSFEKEGKFAFTSQIGGEHKVCFSLNASRWTAGGTKLRLDLKFDVGEMGIDYGEVAKKEHLSELEVEVRRLNDKLKDIMKEQNYQREREVAFRNASELTNSRVATWSVIQVLVMAVSSFFGVNALRSFFQSKKLQ